MTTHLVDDDGFLSSLPFSSSATRLKRMMDWVLEFKEFHLSNTSLVPHPRKMGLSLNIVRTSPTREFLKYPL